MKSLLIVLATAALASAQKLAEADRQEGETIWEWAQRKGAHIGDVPERGQEGPVPDSEQAAFQEIGKFFGTIVRTQAQSTNTEADRALHRKPHLCSKATFEVVDHGVEELKVGLFSEPKQYEASVRLSNGSQFARSDAIPDVRAIATKVFGVEGVAGVGDGINPLPNIGGSQTIDFLGSGTSNQAESVWSFLDLTENSFQPPEVMGAFLQTQQARDNGLLAVVQDIGALGTGNGGEGQRTMRNVPHYVAGVYKLGQDQIIRMNYARCSDLTNVAFPSVDDVAGKEPFNLIRDDVANVLTQQDLCWELQAQTQGTDISRFNPEMLNTKWPVEGEDAEGTARVTVARVIIPMQDVPENPSEEEETCNKQSFHPWNTFENHRPAGQLMRARRPAYDASVKAWGANNGSSQA